MKVIIDRFEGDVAVCETEGKAFINIDRFMLPQGAKEGDVILVEGNRCYIDHKETERLKKAVDELMDDVFE